MLDLLAPHSALINRIKLAYGADWPTFDAEVMPLVRAYADYVQLLPASESQGFIEPGGLLRLGLEVSFYALQGTDSRIFSGRSTISIRRELEPRWRLATFIAGLCSELHLAMGALEVRDSEGKVWPSCLHRLGKWLELRGEKQYTVQWNLELAQSRAYSLFALPLVVPSEVLQDLAKENTLIVPQLFASLSGIPLAQPKNVLDELVRRSLALVLQRHLFLRANVIGARRSQPTLGLHLKRFLVDTLRHLVTCHAAWRVNHEKSRVWLGTDGLYLLWPQSGYEVISLWEHDQLVGLPRTPEELARSLSVLGLCAVHEEGEEAADLEGPTPHVSLIRPPTSKLDWPALRFIHPDLILTAVEPLPTPLSHPLSAAPASVKPDAGQGRTEQRSDSTTGSFLSGAGAGTDINQDSRLHSVEKKTLADVGATQDRCGAPHHSTTTERFASEGHVQKSCPAQPSTPLTSKSISTTLAEAPPPPAPRLEAPLRLNRSIVSLVSDLLCSIHESEAAFHCKARPEGLIVSLNHFNAKGVPAATALRALSDAGMLLQSPDSGTNIWSLSTDVEEAPGLLIAAAFLSHWPPVPWPTADHSHMPGG